MSNIKVVAKLKTKETYNKEVYEILKELHKLTHLYDKGCLQYDLHKDLEDENLFFFIENWKNDDYLKKHEQSNHFNIAISKIEDKIEYVKINKIKYIDL